MKLYKHVNNTDVAIEVVKKIEIVGKDYIRLKVKWWNIKSNKPYCVSSSQWLTDCEVKKNKKERSKYKIDKWKKEWERIEV